jgi:TPP-dependent indolepyruvate ferredoxin oxidoreductase alpha subunit
VRSLETIYGLIKHVITKFVQILNFVVVLNESGTFLEDVLHKALYLSKLKHPKKILSYLSILGWS